MLQSYGFTLKQLRYIEAAGRCGSVATAAQELGISQSSIIGAIDSIESALGYDVFMRAPARGVKLTASGLDVYRSIFEFLNMFRIFEIEMGSYEGVPKGELHIACFVTMVDDVLPPILLGFTEQFPQVAIDVVEGDTEIFIEKLQTGSVDMALTFRRLMPAQMDFLPLFDTRPFAILPKNDPLANQPSVTLADLARKPMIAFNYDDAHLYYGRLFGTRGLEPVISHSTISVELMSTLVAAGLGYAIKLAWLPESHLESAGCSVKAISDDISPSQFGIVTLANVRRTPMANAFMNHCQQLSSARFFDRLVYPV